MVTETGRGTSPGKPLARASSRPASAGRTDRPGLPCPLRSDGSAAGRSTRGIRRIRTAPSRGVIRDARIGTCVCRCLYLASRTMGPRRARRVARVREATSQGGRAGPFAGAGRRVDAYRGPRYPGPAGPAGGVAGDRCGRARLRPAGTGAVRRMSRWVNVGGSFYGGKKVGRAFQPDGTGLSGWKARPT